MATESHRAGVIHVTIYVVRPGDTLFVIARRFGVTIESIAQLNDIPDPNVLVVGQALAIPEPQIESPVLRYTVVRGDTLWGIAALFDVTVAEIVAANNIADPNLIYVGQVLAILRWTFQTYTVVAGDTLSRIAARFGTTVEMLARVNRIADPNLIFVGQILIIPIRDVLARPKPLIETLGYIFPLTEASIRRILEETGRYITYTGIFSFPVEASGGLRPVTGFRPAVTVSRSLDISPLAVVSNFDGVNFNPAVARGAMTGAARSATIASILSLLAVENFAGVNVDFENMYPEDRQLYTSFIADLSAAVRGAGFLMTNAMAPKSADLPNQPWVGAFDYRALAPHLDFTLLMTYEWGWSGGPPEAIAPANLVRRVLEYAVVQIPPGKILQGMPLYGYDWLVPAPPGTLATTVTPPNAVALAARFGADINYDPIAQAPWFRYTDAAGRRHEVWFEDVRSVQAKHAMTEEFNLRGTGYWNFFYSFNQNWLVVEDRFRVRKYTGGIVRSGGLAAA